MGPVSCLRDQGEQATQTRELAPVILFYPFAQTVMPHPDATRILMVDDQKMPANVARQMLAALPRLEFRHCEDSKAAVATAVEFQPHVILQDLSMPPPDGFALLELYRAEPGLAAVPVMVLSSDAEEADRARAFEAGASDFVKKMPPKAEMLARVRYHAEARRCRLRLDALGEP